MKICASLAILPDQCLICLTKVQLLPPPLYTMCVRDLTDILEAQGLQPEGCMRVYISLKS